LEGARVLVTGGTGSLGKVLVRRIFSGEIGLPDEVIIFSRDEAKQHFMRMEWQRATGAVTDERIYEDFRNKLKFVIGDVRDYDSVFRVLEDVDVVFNAAALKQVPTCEYFPLEAVKTNILGAGNIVRAVEAHPRVKTVVGISTDKAVKPVNVMGMTKAIQERVFIEANIHCPACFIVVRYGNVLASRGSVIPLFHDQIKHGGPLTITTRDMTRFLLTLDDAVTAVFTALKEGEPGETYVPIVPSARVIDIAVALKGDRPIDVQVMGIRPGEKTHEILVSEEEAYRTVRRECYYVILPMLREIRGDGELKHPLEKEYSSDDAFMKFDDVEAFLRGKGLMVEDYKPESMESLR
jgi:UDP-glucose 4-epimerase